jgi:hypothetical protein
VTFPHSAQHPQKTQPRKWSHTGRITPSPHDQRIRRLALINVDQGPGLNLRMSCDLGALMLILRNPAFQRQLRNREIRLPAYIMPMTAGGFVDINSSVALSFIPSKSDYSNMSYLIISSALILAAFVLLHLLFKTEQPRIKGIHEIPGWPIVGNLIELGSDHAGTCMKWAKKYGPVFQVRYSRVLLRWSLQLNTNATGWDARGSLSLIHINP